MAKAARAMKIAVELKESEAIHELLKLTVARRIILSRESTP